MFIRSRALLAVFILVTVQAINVGAIAGTSVAQIGVYANLNEYDRNLISDYTSRGYFINRWLDNVIDTGIEGLRGPMAPSSPSDAQTDITYVRHLNRALEKLPGYGIPGEAKAYRGIYHTSETPIEQRYYKGRVWIERRYTSASSDLAVATSFALGAFKNEGCGGCDSRDVQKPDLKKAVIITILSRSGKDITQHSAKSEEKEILFKSGLPFKVLEAVRDNKGRYIVTIAELDPENLSNEERIALVEGENQRNDALIQKYYGSNDAFIALASEWNDAYKSWTENNELDKELDLEALAAEGD